MIRGGADGEESTKIDGVVGQDPENDPEALLYFIGYETRAFVRARARSNPGAFRINWILAEWLQAHYPQPGVPDRKRKLDTWQGYKNAVVQLCEWFIGRTLSDWHYEIAVQYYHWRLQQPLKRGARNADEVRDSPAIAQAHILVRAIDWAKQQFGFVYNTDCRVPAETPVEREWLTYDEIMRLMWACLGFVHENGNWKTKTIERDGRTVTVPYRLPRKQWAKTQWMYRLFVVLFLTGTRYRTARPLHWYRQSKQGCIDAVAGVIWRNGRNAPKYNNKPRGRSDLLPLAAKIFKRWLAWDLRFAEKTGRPPRYVVRNSEGGRLRNVDTMLVVLFERAGLESSAHKLKHAGVTLLGLAGYTRREIAEAFSNAEDTLRDHYEHIPWDDNEQLKLQDKRPEVKKFSDLRRESPAVDLASLMAKMEAA